MGPITKEKGPASCWHEPHVAAVFCLFQGCLRGRLLICFPFLKAFSRKMRKLAPIGKIIREKGTHVMPLILQSMTSVSTGGPMGRKIP